jgi:hypothetical protein
MAIRKTKIPVQKLPPPVRWLLDNLSSDELTYLIGLSSDSKFEHLVNIVGKYKDYNVYKVFDEKVADATELLTWRAALRGEVAGLDTLLYVIQYAQEEIDNRRSKK